jgi:hypothetical protein
MQRGHGQILPRVQEREEEAFWVWVWEEGVQVDAFFFLKHLLSFFLGDLGLGGFWVWV